MVATEWRAEALAADSIRNLGIDARLFFVNETVPGLKPARIARRLAFPGYVLAHWCPRTDPWRHIVKDSRKGIAGILHAVGHPDRPATIPDLAMAILLDRADEAGTLDAREPEPIPDLTSEVLEVSDPSHPFHGLAGICTRSTDERVRILLSVLGGEREVIVRRDSVQVRATP